MPYRDALTSALRCRVWVVRRIIPSRNSILNMLLPKMIGVLAIISGSCISAQIIAITTIVTDIVRIRGAAIRAGDKQNFLLSQLFIIQSLVHEDSSVDVCARPFEICALSQPSTRSLQTKDKYHISFVHE